MEENSQLVSSDFSSAADEQAVRHMKQAIADGRHWYLALLGAIGLWASAEEVRDNRICRYLIDGEAFDWLLLAERLCEAVDGSLPENEQHDLLFYGIPPLELSAGEVRTLIGDVKYGQYLNYFYGVTVEEALILAVQEEIDKERLGRGLVGQTRSADEAYRRVYDADRLALLAQFRQAKGYGQLESTTLNELKEFTYWLFKYRLKSCEKAKIASDTKKALKYLKRQWSRKGAYKVLASDFAIEGDV